MAIKHKLFFNYFFTFFSKLFFYLFPKTRNTDENICFVQVSLNAVFKLFSIILYKLTFWLLFNNAFCQISIFHSLVSFPYWMCKRNAWMLFFFNGCWFLTYSWSVMIRDNIFESEQEHVHWPGTETKKP